MPSTMSTNVLTLLQRPRPPAELTTIGGLMDSPNTFLPAPELRAWIHDAYLDESGPLYTPDHQHLNSARIACLWTNTQNSRGGRSIVGQAEMPERSKSPRWLKARQDQQLREWFGVIPDFLITIDAVYADTCDDATFAALIDHELCHCAQAEDEFGMPRFNKDTGLPVFTIRGHDVEEFLSVVRRFGIQAAGQAATDMVIAAAQKPTIAPAKLSQACGTCALRAA